MTKIDLNKNTINFRSGKYIFSWVCVAVCDNQCSHSVSLSLCLTLVRSLVALISIEMRIVSFASFLSKKSFCHILLLIIGSFCHLCYALFCCILYTACTFYAAWHYATEHEAEPVEFFCLHTQTHQLQKYIHLQNETRKNDNKMQHCKKDAQHFVTAWKLCGQMNEIVFLFDILVLQNANSW